MNEELPEGSPDGASQPPEELLVLRYLFGLGENPFPAEDQLGPTLADTLLKDVVLVSIQAAGHPDDGEEQHNATHVGVSMFNLRRLQLLLRRNKDSAAGLNLINSMQFQLKPEPIWRYLRKAYIFGKSKRSRHTRFAKTIKSLLKNRRIVLVTYGDSPKSENLAAEISLSPAYHLRLSNAMRFPLPNEGQNHFIWRQELLTHLGLPWKAVPVAGNSARLAIHALFMIAVNDWNVRMKKRTTCPEIHTRKTISFLRQMAKEWRRPPSNGALRYLGSLFEEEEEEVDSDEPPIGHSDSSTNSSLDGISESVSHMSLSV
ncbi:hypothetical protein F5Y01DRAFT_220517 [Xylaria sp. FL0043]|nr:hypothetical protein F5Y01DRAFT_220517 [Xylaria sp. FL0043]